MRRFWPLPPRLQAALSGMAVVLGLLLLAQQFAIAPLTMVLLVSGLLLGAVGGLGVVLARRRAMGKVSR